MNPGTVLQGDANQGLEACYFCTACCWGLFVSGCSCSGGRAESLLGADQHKLRSSDRKKYLELENGKADYFSFSWEVLILLEKVRQDLLVISLLKVGKCMHCKSLERTCV